MTLRGSVLLLPVLSLSIGCSIDFDRFLGGNSDAGASLGDLPDAATDAYAPPRPP
jgi:hypothetical protein